MRTADQPIRISLIAANGRMGQAIATAVAEDSRFELDQDHADVLVDFSAPAALQASLDRAVSANIPILIGTTGLDELADQRIATAANKVAFSAPPIHRLASPSLPNWSSARRRCWGPNGISKSPKPITAIRPTRRRALR